MKNTEGHGRFGKIAGRSPEGGGPNREISLGGGHVQKNEKKVVIATKL